MAEVKKDNPKPAQTSTKPGVPAPRAKKEKVKRVDYPGLKVDAEGKATVKLKDYPTDFDSKVHKQLKRQHFENEAPLLERRAADLQKKVDALKNEAADARAGKTSGARGKVKKLRSMMEKFAEIKKDLDAEGVDTKEFAAMLREALGAPAPEAVK